MNRSVHSLLDLAIWIIWILFVFDVVDGQHTVSVSPDPPGNLQTIIITCNIPSFTGSASWLSYDGSSTTTRSTCLLATNTCLPNTLLGKYTFGITASTVYVNIANYDSNSDPVAWICVYSGSSVNYTFPKTSSGSSSSSNSSTVTVIIISIVVPCGILIIVFIILFCCGWLDCCSCCRKHPHRKTAKLCHSTFYCKRNTCLEWFFCKGSKQEKGMCCCSANKDVEDHVDNKSKDNREPSCLSCYCICCEPEQEKMEAVQLQKKGPSEHQQQPSLSETRTISNRLPPLKQQND